MLKGESNIVITHTSAYLRYLPSKQLFKDSVKRIVVGETVSKRELELFLQKNGYKRVNKVCNTNIFVNNNSFHLEEGVFVACI